MAAHENGSISDSTPFHSPHPLPPPHNNPLFPTKNERFDPDTKNASKKQTRLIGILIPLLTSFCGSMDRII